MQTTQFNVKKFVYLILFCNFVKLNFKKKLWKIVEQ